MRFYSFTLLVNSVYSILILYLAFMLASRLPQVQVHVPSVLIRTPHLHKLDFYSGPFMFYLSLVVHNLGNAAYSFIGS